MLRQEAQIPGSGPTSVANQTGENKNLVDWIRNAWREIQLLHDDWQWRTASFSFTTDDGIFSYTPADAGIATRFSAWDSRSISIYQTSQGPSNGTPLPFLDYVRYRDYYIIGNQVGSRPVIHSVAPNLNLLIGPKPSDIGYTVEGEYRKSAQELTVAGDIPEMPEDFHMMIVYKALMKYARAEAAGEIYEDANTEYKRLKYQLEMKQLPAVLLAETLVE